jgi:hypothetical protein
MASTSALLIVSSDSVVLIIVYFDRPWVLIRLRLRCRLVDVPCRRPLMIRGALEVFLTQIGGRVTRTTVSPVELVAVD